MCKKYKMIFILKKNKIIFTFLSLVYIVSNLNAIDFSAIERLKAANASNKHQVAVKDMDQAKRVTSNTSTPATGFIKDVVKFTKSVGEYSRNESDMKKLCLARAEYSDTYCYGIKNEDTKNLCLGITKYKSNCYSISNEDEKSLCLAVSEHKYKSMCFSIRNNDTKNLCLAMTHQYKTSCFGIKNKDKKNLCLGVTKNKSNCFSIR